VSTLNGAMLALHGTKYTMDFPSVENRAPLEGNFHINGNKITFSNPSPDAICGSESGTYSFVIEGDDLTIELISDNCKKRSKNLETTWFKL